MLGFAEDQKNRRVPTNLIARCAISFVSASLAQFSLSMVPRLFPASSLLCLFSLSAIALLAMAGVGKLCKKLVRVRASAPALVFFNIAFVWGVYVGVVRRVISPLMDILLNAEFLMLIIGLCSILSTDPDYVTNESSNLDKLGGSSVSELVPSTCGIPCELATEDVKLIPSSIPLQRVRYCSHCKKYVKGFDHHCPAFGNCIGQENHALFIILLFGFVVTEASYVTCSSQIRTEAQILYKTEGQISLSKNLGISTMLFCLLQVPWQVVLLMWHIYCVCFNIKTDEWINWYMYPEFHLTVQAEPGLTPSRRETRFTNPYTKGILGNLREFIASK